MSSPEKIKAVAARLAEAHRNGDDQVVVVSAMGRTTDELLALSRQVHSSPPRRELDLLISVGERISMTLLSMALDDENVDAISYTGSQAGIITSDEHGEARIQEVKPYRLKDSLSQNKVVIVAGFQGVSDQKEVTTLGRGGSDTTAVALAVALKCKEVEIYTDVDGVYSADPLKVTSARRFSQLSYRMMSQMAKSGAKVLHPRCVQLAQKFKIPIWVSHAHGQDSKIGTWIQNSMETSKLETSVSANETSIWIDVALQRNTTWSYVLDTGSQSNLSMRDWFFDESQLRFLISVDELEAWKSLLEAGVRDGYLKEFAILEEWVPITVVFEGEASDSSILEQALTALQSQEVPYRFCSFRGQVLHLAVKKSFLSEALQCLHEAW